MMPEHTKKAEGETRGNIRDDVKKVIQELDPDELAAVESISAGNGDVVICNSKCAAAAPSISE